MGYDKGWKLYATWRHVVLLLSALAAVAQTDLAPANQQYVPNMTFDVASVRPLKIEPGVMSSGVFFRPSNSSHLSGTSDLRAILQTAFSVEYYQIVGYAELSPDVVQLLYVIQAHSDESADKLLANLPKVQRQAEQQHMLQTLLVDRFRLKFHWEDRHVSGYRLVIAKRGSKLLPAGSLPLDSDVVKMKTGDGKMPAIHEHHVESGIVQMGRGASLADLASLVSFRMGAPVEDATGLGGKYDFDLRTNGRTAEDNPQESPQGWPPMIYALQDQLGLRLEAAQITQKVLVIDHMEAPSPN